MRRTTIGAVGAVAALALVGAACTDDMDSAATEDTSTTTTMEAMDGDMSGMDHMSGDMADGNPVATPASELRAGLTSLLQEHVYLAGIAISTAVSDGMDAPSTTAAVEALDENSVALSEAIGSVYGDEAAEQFLALWRAHIGMFVDYTTATASGDTAGAEAAKAELDDYRGEFAAFVESATDGELAADTTADNLQVHVDTLIVAIDAVVAGDPGAFAALREAAQHMPSTAMALSAAIAAQMPDQFGS